MTKISLIIITYNSQKDIIKYLDSLIKHNDLSDVTIQIIEASNDLELTSIVDTYKNKVDITINYIENKGYAYACNQGIKYAPKADLYILSNPDIIITSEIISSIRKEFNVSNYGTIIQKNSNFEKCTFDLYPQYKNIVTEVLFVPKLMNMLNIYIAKLCYITGAFMIFGKNIIKENGLFDENFFLYYEETDYYYRLRNNNNNKIIKDRYIIHNISSSIDSNKTIDKFHLSFNSLSYYSKKHSSYFYIKNLIFLYRITSLFIKKHVKRYEYLKLKN